MLTLKHIIKSKFILLTAGALTLVSCGTQNQAAQQQDGIYERPYQTQNTEVATENNGHRSNYYKQYFQTKSPLYHNAQQEQDVIFTDIESSTPNQPLAEPGTHLA